MNCIIVDDEELARAIIYQFASIDTHISGSKEFDSGIAAIKYLNTNPKVDLIFLDIHMPGFNGFDFIQTINSEAKIILTTSDKNFAIQAFEYDVIVDYLVKPITLERFQKSIQKALDKKPVENTQNPQENLPNTSNKDDLFVNVDRKLIKIDVPTIQVIEAKGDYILIKTGQKNYTVHSTLKKIQEHIHRDYFIKVHRSFIININEIVDIKDNSVLISKNVIPISRSKRPELMKRLNLL
ncbi:LytTR family two component transcriptional regulator [Gillisia sp. Hel_I_86]|uniref:LytR/AlgR family response regulator transcription factor n=1 Tax=Gillisia sp. Hel_I_86 TaxID=1249981 RepID=UPI00119A7E1B|nr:LytTR family DNA-binding domain-containing protein [Gillisia sp. Hel_I_86]TVZ25491.1 LytTR family two component transcriptional regulator [Gillisia sp. Hel_I_86]